MRAVLILALALAAGACAVDGPEDGATDPMARMEAQERLRRQAQEQARLCAMMDPESERYARDCR